MDIDCLVNEHTTQNKNFVWDQLTSNGEWAASLPRPSFGGLGGCRWTGCTDWNATGAQLESTAISSTHNFPPNFLTRPQFGHQLLSAACLFLAWPLIWLHLKSVSIPGCNKWENLHLDNAYKLDHSPLATFGSWWPLLNVLLPLQQRRYHPQLLWKASE